MGNAGVGVGGVVSAIGWESRRQNGTVDEEKIIAHIQLRFGVSREDAEFAIEIAEKCGAIERKNKKLHVKPRKIREVG